MTTLRRQQPNNAIWILALLAFAVLYRLYGLSGYIGWDSCNYAQFAYNIVQGNFGLDNDSYFAHRLPVFVPVAPLYWAFGVNTLSTHLWTLLLSVAQIAIVIWFTLRMYGRRVAFLAGAMLALFPLDVIEAGDLRPDTVIAAFSTFSVVLWVYALERRPRRRALLLFLSGVFLALAAVARLYVILNLAFYGLYVIWKRPPMKSVFWGVLGMAAVFVPLAIGYQVVTGTVLYRFEILRAAAESATGGARPWNTQILFYPGLLWHIRSETGLFPFLFVVLGLPAALLAPRRERYLLLWIAPMFLYLQFGTMSLKAYVAVFKTTRYLTPLLAPGVILIAMGVDGLLGWAERHRRFGAGGRSSPWLRSLAVVGFLVVMLANSVQIVDRVRDRKSLRHDAFVAAAELVQSDKSLPILFDHYRTAILFQYYLKFEEGAYLHRGVVRERMQREFAPEGWRLGYMRWYPTADSVPPAWIVLDDDALEQVRLAKPGSVDPYGPDDIPQYCYDPPADWRLEGRFGELRVFRD